MRVNATNRNRQRLRQSRTTRTGKHRRPRLSIVVGIPVAVLPGVMVQPSRCAGFEAARLDEPGEVMNRMKLLMLVTLLFAFSVASAPSAPSAPSALDDLAVATRANIGVADAATAPATHVEKEIILATVRRYRPTTDERWVGVLAESVHSEARAAGVDPLLVAAMVARESSFQSQVVSNAGAVGLMQVRPWVARDVAARRQDAEIEWQGLETLHDPDSNVRLGVLYYLELMNRFDSDPVTALEAYNRGPSRVSHELRKGDLSRTHYSNKVLTLYEELDAERSLLDSTG